LIKDLAVPAVENVTGPFDWKGPKNEMPEWQKCMALNCLVKDSKEI
jgi:hypothetical protein